MIIMHIDANSAYLSWTAADMLENGYDIDIRNIPSAIAGDPDNRHGIILTKSTPAKRYGIKTGESLLEARRKCPDLKVFPPDYDLYMRCSNAMYDILCRYSPAIQRYSVDECFLDYTRSTLKFGDPVKAAYEIKEAVKEELGFTVNIGVSTNKLLAKMASELKKPDMVHTIFPCEIEKKMWPLDISELFMVGRATAGKLKAVNINTIGDLANADRALIKALLKSHGELVWEYANGMDGSPVVLNEAIVQKGVGNSITVPYDVLDMKEAREVLLALSERVGMRLRAIRCISSLVSLHLRTSELWGYGHQVQLQRYTDSTSDIYDIACGLLEECWKGESLRQIGVSVSHLSGNADRQLTIFDREGLEKEERLNKTVDAIRREFGERVIERAVFANTETDPIQGGVNDGNYLMMGGYKNEDLGASH